MRIYVSLFATLLVAPLALAQWSCPSHYDLSSSTQGQDGASQSGSDTPTRQYDLQGMVGSRTVKMYLNRAGSDSDGLFYFLEGDWTPVFLFGDWKPDGFEFSGESKNQKPTGRLQGQLADNLLLGQWTPAGSDRAEPVRLLVVPKTSCDGKGAWKRFDNPNWPFSFSYPASWHIKEEHGYIHVMCPDPEEMVYDTDVTISEGLGEPSAETGLARCGMEWRYYANCSDDLTRSAYSHIPVESVRHGMRILDMSEHEWRLYCRNGG